MAQIVTAFVALLLAFATGGVLAQSGALADPTRPAINAPDMPGSATETALIGLQSIRIDPQGRKTALIHGQWVGVGEPAGEARVVAIHDSTAVLRHPDGNREILKMFPDVELTKKTGQSLRPGAAAR